jgi:hypothetical protein
VDERCSDPRAGGRLEHALDEVTNLPDQSLAAVTVDESDPDTDDRRRDSPGSGTPEAMDAPR